MKGKLKVFLYFVLAALVFGVSLKYMEKANDGSALRTSVLTTLQAINANLPEKTPVDLAIEKVTLKKISGPKADFGYSKYNATMIIHNYGGHLNNGGVVIAAGDQKASFVRNTEDGFSLASGKNYIVDNYEIIFDSAFNGGEIEFSVSLKTEEDGNLKNNKMTAKVFEGAPRLENFKIKSIADDGKISVDFKDDESGDYLIEYMVAPKISYENEDKNIEYKEVDFKKGVYGYFSLKNTREAIDSPLWKSVSADALKVTNVDYYLYAKATDPQTGDYFVSDILRIPNGKNLSKARFAETFVRYTGMRINTEGELFYDDVKADDIYYKAVKTLYNMGLVEYANSFHPDEEMTRGEVLKTVMNYFDADLKIGEDAPHFKEVNEEDAMYTYVESLYEENKAPAIWENFALETPATEEYLTYLIDAYRETD